MKEIKERKNRVILDINNCFVTRGKRGLRYNAGFKMSLSGITFYQTTFLRNTIMMICKVRYIF